MFNSNKLMSLSVIPFTLSCPHNEISFTVELPRTPQEFMQGLMHRTALAENTGMLFHYDPPRSVAMWMKNTLLPLDMIFGDKDGHILAIYENTIPYSLDTIGPIKETTYVLEVAGGTVSKQGITMKCVIK